MQDVLEASALLANAVRRRHHQAVDEQHVRVHGAAAHLVDLAHLDVLAVQRRVEQAQALRGLGHGFQRRGARQQQHARGHLRRGDPDLAAIHAIGAAIVRAHRLRLQVGGIEPRVRLGHGEAGLFLPGDQRRQRGRLLGLGAEHHHRVQAEHVHVDGGRAGESRPGRRHGLHDQRRLGNAEPRATVLLRHGNAEPARAGHRLVKRLGKLMALVQPGPVVGAEVAA
ncbi:hypothetical protein D3C86_1576660 [compost metagenome]